jgi:hypothetical protein
MRGLWVRATPIAAAMLRDRSAWQAFFDFCDAPHGNPEARIGAIYLEPPRDLEEAGLCLFLSAAHDRGLRVEFLFGDAEWQADHLDRARAVCGRVVETSNPAHPVAERFDGLHLDIESGGKWSQSAFRGLLLFLRQKIDSYNAREHHRMTLAADLGFWWSERGDEGTPQYPDAVAQCDYIVSMAYRDTAGAQVSCAVPEALAAAQRKKDLYLGLETQRIVDGDYITYYEEGWEYMERELAKLPALLAAQGGRVAGVAIHHYDSYLRMAREHRQSPFSDVRLDFWALPYLVAAQAAGIIGGYPDGTYRPAEPVSNADMAVFLSHALVGRGKVPEGPPRPSFPDVPATHWAYKYIECARAHQVMTGEEDGLFHPDEPVSRGRMTVFIARSIVNPTGDTGLAGYAPPSTPTFPDVTPETGWGWSYRHTEFIAARGIARGYPDGLYHPELPCTRDQMAVYLVKAFGLPIE